MLVSTTVAISHGGCSLSNVMIQSKIKPELPLSEKLCPASRLASGTNIIGILINLRIDPRAEWHLASLTPSFSFKKYCY